MQQTLNLKGKLKSLESPLIMGILNITPDSFFDGGRHNATTKAEQQATQMLKDGADIIDIGGYSTRPNAADISVQEELDRVLPVIENLIEKNPEIIISVDTFRSEVAAVSVAVGAAMVNDISGGNLDNNMLDIIGKLKIPYIMMHSKGTPQTMQKECNYENILSEIMDSFLPKINYLKEKDCKDIIIDLGFGFAKTLEQNYYLLNNLEVFKLLDLPILAGISRKSMIYKALNTTAEKVLNGTTILNTIALQKGATILRVHDVKAAKEIVMLQHYLSVSQP